MLHDLCEFFSEDLYVKKAKKKKTIQNTLIIRNKFIINNKLFYIIYI